jgi:hypothetical protein
MQVLKAIKKAPCAISPVCSGVGQFRVRMFRHKASELGLVFSTKIAHARNVLAIALAAELAVGCFHKKVHANLCKSGSTISLIDVGCSEAVWKRPVGPLEESASLVGLDLLRGQSLLRPGPFLALPFLFLALSGLALASAGNKCEEGPKIGNCGQEIPWGIRHQGEWRRQAGDAS